MKFLITGQNVEALQAQEIEADSRDEAFRKYLQLWNDGNISVTDSTIENVAIKGIATNDDTNAMVKWYDHEFESSSGLTEEFSNFSRDFKRDLLKQTGRKFELVNYNRGHFDISGFLKNKESGKYVYFSIGDVRGAHWQYSILVRTAEHEKDYSGGANTFASYEQLAYAAERLS